MDEDNRVVVLIDMDCFYCQVEEMLNPELAGKPIAVVQYNPWKGGGIIAVNYVARAMGVTRHMRGDEAKEKCPEIQLQSVPCSRGKADITKYREAGKKVVKVLQNYTSLLERASIDEAYLDITEPVKERLNNLNVNMITQEMMPNTFVLGYDSLDEFLSDILTCDNESIEFDYNHVKRLLVGAVIVSEMRAAVYRETGYRCSAGIAHNKILAKLVCGMNKPNKQTVLPKHAINILYKTLPLKKVKHLGGKFGDNVRNILRINTMADLQQFSEKELQTKFDEKNGTWLYKMARGINMEPVQMRLTPKSIGCCKQLRGKSALIDLDSLRRWLKDLGEEIEDRLEKDALENNRTPKQMVVSYSTQLPNGQDSSSSRSYNFTVDDDLCGNLFSSKALELLMESAEGVKIKDDEKNRKLKAPIAFLGISVGKFEDNIENKKTRKIDDYFNANSSVQIATKMKETPKEEIRHDKYKKNVGKEYVLQKFFQTTSQPLKNNNDDKKPIETTLDNQESFFAKFLSVNTTSDLKTPNLTDTSKAYITVVRSSTPVCNIVQCCDNSNDTDYSGSTINMEINKSIMLFEDNAEEVVRVSSIRELLKTSEIIEHNNSETNNGNEIQETSEHSNNSQPVEATVLPEAVETFECPECTKTISIENLHIHSDYHLALRLRNEEKELLRQEREKMNKVKEKSNGPEISMTKQQQKYNGESSWEKVPSIANFLVKLDETIPTKVCAVCDKKIPVHKFTEHLDFHEAQKLSRILNNKPSPICTTESNTKRKRKFTSPVKKTKVACKSIDSFFKQ